MLYNVVMNHEYMACDHGNHREKCLICHALFGAPHRHVPRLVVDEPKPYVPNTVIEEEDREGNRVLRCIHLRKLFMSCEQCSRIATRIPEA
jgi:hypothetical protein